MGIQKLLSLSLDTIFERWFLHTWFMDCHVVRHLNAHLAFLRSKLFGTKNGLQKRLHLVSYFSDDHRKWPCIASSRKFYSEQYHQWKRKYHPYRKPSKLEGHRSSYQWRRPHCCGSTTAVRRHNSTQTSAFDIRNKWKKFRQWYRGFEIQR